MKKSDFIIQFTHSFARHTLQSNWLVFRQHLHSRGGLDQEPILVATGIDDRVEQSNGHVVGDQAFAIHREDRRHLNAVVHARADEQAKQHVVLDAVHELPLGAHAIENLQWHDTPLIPRCNVQTAAFDASLVYGGKQAVRLEQSSDHYGLDRTQR